jgi:steroid delta-isomerase-like uncharacterized protein
MKKTIFQLITVGSLILLVCLTYCCQQKEAEEVPAAVSVEEIKANLQKEIGEAWNKGNVDVLDELYASDMVYHIPPYPDVVGLEAYKKFILGNRSSYPDIMLTIQEVIVEGNSGSMLWTYEGTQEGGSPVFGIPPTGEHVIFKGCAFFHTQDGKTVETWNYVDWVGLMKQLGFTITPPQQEESPEEKK